MLENQILAGILRGEKILADGRQIEWSGFRQRIQALGLKHIAYIRLRHLSDKADLRIPSWFWEDLEADYFKCAIRNELILQEFFTLDEAFTSHEIECLPLKGVSLLLQNCYESTGERVLSDLDVIVSQKNLSRAAEILQDLGYRPFGNPDLALEAYRKQKNHLPPLISPREIPLDLHWRFVMSCGDNRNGEDDGYLWRSKRSVSFSKSSGREGKAWVPSPEVHLLHLMIHWARMALFSLPAWIRMYFDMQAILRHFPFDLKWDEVISEAKNRRLPMGQFFSAMRVIDPLLSLPEGDWRVQENASWESALRRMKASLWQHDGIPPLQDMQKQTFLISWAKAGTGRSRLALLGRILWPSARYVREESKSGRNRFSRLVKMVDIGMQGLWPKRLLSLLKKPGGVGKSVCVVRNTLRISRWEKYLPFPEMLRRLDVRKKGPQHTLPEDIEHTVEVVDWFLGLNRGALRPNCLRRAMVLFSLLRRQGVPVTFHCGLRNRFEGHSWLTLEGEPFCERANLPLTEFVETYRFP